MRYIPIHELSIDSSWKAEANAAALAVLNSSKETRSSVINSNQKVWKKLKEKLANLSHQKCWYCESINPRSDNAVDHYRPKGNVRDVNPPHEGYWWLAFDWHNYRFSCGFCNSIRNSATTSGGKQDYFPLWDEKGRARSKADDIDDEYPMLLDPTNPLHILLIAFADDGSVGPAYDSTRSPEHEMAKITIKRYHLDERRLVDLRAVRISEVRKWVEEADRLLTRYVRDPKPFVLKSVTARMEDILAAISPKGVYSAAVKHLLAGMETGSEAAKKILTGR